VDLDGVGGPAEVTVRQGGLVARELGGGARVRAWDDDVSIAGSAGPLDVEIERGSADIAPAAPITEPITVSVKGGAIRLEVPRDSHFDLDARSRGDELDIDVPGLDVTESDTGSGVQASGSMGGGGARVSLTADEEITLTEGSSAPLPAEAEAP
jgi:hypothetical protein